MTGARQLSKRFGIEASLQGISVLSGNSAEDVATGSRVEAYDILGGALGLSLDLGRLRWSAGTGVYVLGPTSSRERVPPDPPAPKPFVTAGFHAGLEMRIKRWRSSALLLAARAILFPDVRSKQLLYFPIEIGFRAW